ncbi:TPA: hypothetical protein HHH16_002887, partial [Escherichia coli]|nr:hypothetical protein [Escherichia coli]
HQARPNGPAKRFIPAGAGNSRWTENLLATYPVYPRWRGELVTLIKSAGDVPGLSPLARGTL